MTWRIGSIFKLVSGSGLWTRALREGQVRRSAHDIIQYFATHTLVLASSYSYGGGGGGYTGWGTAGELCTTRTSYYA